MRTFIAIELSEDIRNALAQVQSHLKYSGADVKWVEKDNIHLTLKFLGEVSEEKIKEIIQILDDIGKETKSFEITLKDIGAFPNIEFPRVVWVGLDKGAIESKALAERIDDSLSKIGFQREARPFAAHLTVGRVRSPKNKEALKEKILSASSQLPTPTGPIGPLGRRPNSQLISAVTLYKSTLTPKGSIYSKLHETKLSGNR